MNAAIPQVNRHILTGLSATYDAVRRLTTLGIAVIGVDPCRSRPVIRVEASRRCHQLGAAAAYRFSSGPMGRVNTWQVQYHGCRVEWDAKEESHV